MLSGEAVARQFPHTLRRTYAALALRQGVPIEGIIKNLGQGSPAITLTVDWYGLDDKLQATVVDLFPVPARLPNVPAAVLN